MQIKVILTTIVLWILPQVLVSQVTQDKINIYKKNQVGIQFNPFINEQFFDFRYVNTVSALRYGYRITKNVTTGIEFSCDFPINIASIQNFQIYNYFSYKTGLYARYLYPAHSRFQIFAEASPYFSHYWKELTSSSDLTPFRDSKFGYYVAPGVTLYSKRKRVSFDLYYKFSNLMLADGKRSVLSYKVNFNF